MLIEFFDTLPAEQAHLAGGKGGTLAKLTQLGYPVPAGFVLGAEAFDGKTTTPEGWHAVRQGVARLRAGGATAFAVRSSARGEDSAQASFAGEFETVLEVRTEAEIRAAIERVWASRHSERVRAYAQAQGLDGEQHMAVVVQAMVLSELSGVLFTVDPVSGDPRNMIGNFVEGLGEKLVSGEANAEVFELARATGTLNGASSAAVHARLSDYAHTLFELGKRLETDLRAPQDIEWAIANGQLFLLQSRPITTLNQTETWNDALLGDYLWASTNFGEAIPEVMTPMTWSMMQMFFKVNRLGIETDTLPMGGNLGGHMYINLTMMASLFSALGFPRAKILEMVAETFGNVPEGVDIPILPMTRWQALKVFVPKAFRRIQLVNRLKKQVPRFVAESPAKAEALTTQIQATQTAGDLAHLWATVLLPELENTMLMLAAGTSDYKRMSRIRRAELNRLVGEADANALLSGIQQDGSHLASLGPLLGLTKLARGEMSRAAYMHQFGHRGPSEFELSIPTPAEDPTLLDQPLNEMTVGLTTPARDATQLLAQKRQQHESAWERFVALYPGKARTMRQQLETLYEAATMREAARSEVIRMLRVFRAFALKAGDLTGLGAEVFFLSFEEVVTLLQTPARSPELLKNTIEKRKRTYARYASLPPYPSVIRGKFEPFAWAADPARRTDIFIEGDSHRPILGADDPKTLRGFAGSPGVVEGMVRVLQTPGEGHQLVTGEILVANTTNVGWTPLFPRAAAIITDVGAPLSHAAIVARELGIPAVVGTGNATMRLKTGDRVRVHGGQGVVEVLGEG